MSHLALTFLGAFQAHLDGTTLTTFHSAKVQGLLAYLALEATRPHARETLVALFWPDDAPQSAQQSLRQALYALRRTLGETENTGREPFLLVTRQTVQLNPAAPVALDVAAFLQQVQQGNPEQAAALYTAELLTGLTTDSAPFEEWLRATRQYLHNLALNALHQLTQQQLDRGDYRQAALYARRQLTLEPWREEAHRQVMTALAHNGDRSAALAQYESCRRVLAEELGVEPAAETIAVYEQIRAGKLHGQPARPNPLPASPMLGEEPLAPRHNLPPQPTPFIGRQTDLEQITARLQDPTCRLLTIVGPGGMGKTRLAIQAAQAILDFRFWILDSDKTPQNNPKSKIQNPKFEDGVFFVALAGVGSPDLLISAIAAALDFTFYGSGDAKTQLVDYLRTKTLLLLLDNCEHLLDGIELVSDLLAAAPKLKVLATSREPLNLREEWLHALGGMSVPRIEENGARVEQYTAIQLFVQCARRMKPAFDLAAESRTVVQICQLVDGMPLGIELAATWLKFYGCPQIIQEMQRSLDFLATTLRNLPARHRSMRAVFEHSWHLLSPPEQAVFQRLAVFRGGFDRRAAQQVADATFPLLVTLAEKSLIQVGTNERYQMHELLRQFAEEKLSSNPSELDRVQNEHCRYYTTFLDQQEPRLKGPEHLVAMLAIEAEIENVRTAWEQAVARDHLHEIEQALESLAYFHETKCWFDQSIALFHKAADVLTSRPPQDRRLILLARILTKQGLMQALLTADAGRPPISGTRQLLEQSLTILQPFGETRSTGDIFMGLSYIVHEPQEAQRLRHLALAIYERHDDRWRMARTLEGIGFAANILGQYEAAKEFYRRGIALCQGIGDYRVLGDIEAIFAEVHRALGDYAEAKKLAHASLVARTEAGNKRGIAFSFYVLGAIAWRMGNWEEALHYSRQSRDTFSEIGLLGGIDYALSNLGHIACSLGDYAEARRQFHQILHSNLARDFLTVQQPVPWALAGMANVLRQEGQPVQAIELIELVLRHPNAWQEAKNLAAQLLNELSAELPAEIIATTQAQTRDLKTVVAEVLLSFEPAMQQDQIALVTPLRTAPQATNS